MMPINWQASKIFFVVADFHVGLLRLGDNLTETLSCLFYTKEPFSGLPYAKMCSDVAGSKIK